MDAPSTQARYAALDALPARARACLEGVPRLHYQNFAATWRDEHRFLKVQPRGGVPSLRQEAERIEWLDGQLRVPRVVALDHDDTSEWMCTEALPGVDATRLEGDPEQTVAIFARGLRRFHDALDPASCPFRFTQDIALAHIQARGTPGPSATRAFEDLLRTRPPERDLVVCHGDYCFPNVLIEDGHVTAYLDLGEVGVAGRWFDLAIATATCTWNLGPGYEGVFLRHYGAAMDPEQRDWYRQLYELVS